MSGKGYTILNLEREVYSIVKQHKDLFRPGEVMLVGTTTMDAIRVPKSSSEAGSSVTLRRSLLDKTTLSLRLKRRSALRLYLERSKQRSRTSGTYLVSGRGTQKKKRFWEFL